MCHSSAGVLGSLFFFFFFQAEDGIRDYKVTGVQTCALPICGARARAGANPARARGDGGARRAAGRPGGDDRLPLPGVGAARAPRAVAEHVRAAGAGGGEGADAVSVAQGRYASTAVRPWATVPTSSA